METTAASRRWCGARDPVAFSRWVADRAAGVGPHLAPVIRVGRCPQGHLAAEVLHPATRSLEDTLDVLGVPTEGVAVTLTVPLLELAARARSGAVELGVVALGAVGVDETGAILVADRPPGAVDVCADGPPAAPGAESAAEPGPSARAQAGPSARAQAGPSARAQAGSSTREQAGPSAHAGAGLPHPRDLDGARQLVTAARMVWDRVDSRSEARRTLDPALDAARDGDADTVAGALDLVVGAAPPRPVRWSTPGPTFPDEEPAGTGAPAHDQIGPDGVVGMLIRAVLDVLERGVPAGHRRRVPVRHVVVGAVVTGGLVTAATHLR
ncbi:hypothetical protein [Curtobacterium sp. TXMA1]|uniref:hypothetical protein n=1 Tax=Curtobacterium sp. TXMA1 TaxID=2876939 RepID=UPI001CCA3F89|nr:hypothetical protein [Curtobacterium sp. TXMA1]UBQ03918.1 hypothetical protein LCG91_07165 [Curtobacterium sp. TXMA1]